MTENEEREAYYDKFVAPELAKIAKDCASRGISFISAVEYNRGEIGETRMFVPGFSKTMMLLSDIMRMSIGSGRNT